MPQNEKRPKPPVDLQALRDRLKQKREELAKLGQRFYASRRYQTILGGPGPEEIAARRAALERLREEAAILDRTIRKWSGAAGRRRARRRPEKTP